MKKQTKKAKPTPVTKPPRKVINVPMTSADPYTEILIGIAQIRTEIMQVRVEITKTFHDECCPKVIKISDEITKIIELRLRAEDNARRLTVGLPPVNK